MGASVLNVTGGKVQVTGGKVTLQSGNDCPTCFFRSNWEGTGILDSSAWDSEAGTTGALTVATDQYLQGTHALKFNRNSNTTDYILKSITSTATIGVRFAIRINARGTGETTLQTGTGSGNDLWYFIVNGTSQVFSLQNPRGGAYVGSDFSFSYDTWYQVEILFINDTSLKWKVWNANGTTLVLTEQTATPARAYNCDTVNIGTIFHGGTVTNDIYWFDSFVADNSGYPGPYIP
jgi:hypothetical protein